MAIVRIDARRLTDVANLHATLAEVFGFGATYGKNLDALVDCLSHLDDPKAAMSRVQVLPGQLALIALDHAGGRSKQVAAQIAALGDVIAFVNWRRLEHGQGPVVALAYGAN